LVRFGVGRRSRGSARPAGGHARRRRALPRERRRLPGRAAFGPPRGPGKDVLLLLRSVRRVVHRARGRGARQARPRLSAATLPSGPMTSRRLLRAAGLVVWAFAGIPAAASVMASPKMVDPAALVVWVGAFVVFGVAFFRATRADAPEDPVTWRLVL